MFRFQGLPDLAAAPKIGKLTVKAVCGTASATITGMVSVTVTTSVGIMDHR